MRRIVLALALLLALPVAVVAQNYPARQIRLIVPYPPGGTADPSARLLAQSLSSALGQAVVIDNRGGASGNVGAELVSSAPPDGYVLLFASGTIFTMNPFLFKSLGFDAKDGFASIVNFASVPNILAVNTSVSAQNLEDFTKYVKSVPENSLNYATNGQGSSQNLAMLLYMNLTKTKMKQVPYVNPGQAVLDTIANRAQATAPLLPTVVSMVKSGKLRALAVLSDKRSSALPDVPTSAEAGLPGWTVGNFYTVMAPKGTPSAIVTRLNTEINKLLDQPEFRQRLADMGLASMGGTPEAADDLIKTEAGRWQQVIKSADIVPQ
jgi:tripartite-type tricarboxylate transporter receptor subunit TctC